MMKIRPATLEDAASILQIYAPYILHTAVTFEYEVPTLEEFTQRMVNIMKKFPYFVAEEVLEENGTKIIVGYGYAHALHERTAFNWDAELSFYLIPEVQNKGIAREITLKLMSVLRRQGYRNVYGLVSSSNPHSLHFFKKLGFKECGILAHTGYKLGAWHAIHYWEFSLVGDDLSLPKNFPESEWHKFLD